MKRLALIVVWTLTLSACLSTREEQWPSELPPRHLFVTAYEQDTVNQRLQTREAYLGWIRSFYEGTVVYPTGWLDIQAEVLAGTDSEARTRLAAELESLGAAIGAEWAKENQIRLIDNRLLALWGSILQLAETDGKQFDSISLIAEDVDRLYEGELDKGEIVEERYTGRLGLEAFGGF